MTFAPSDESGGYSRDDRKWRYILRHHRARPDDGPLADRNAREDDGVHADIRPWANAHRLDHDFGFDHRHVRRHAGVLRAEHFRAGTPADAFRDHQIARVEICLGTDPDAVANHAAAVEPPLNERQLTDEHAVANLERLRMLRQRAAANSDSVAESFRQCAPDCAPHARIALAISHRVM